MDYETQTLLQELIKAVKNLDGHVEAINSPDWWMIVLTIINIVAFGFVARTQIFLQKQQTKLQERQAKQQEYEVYRSLYVLVEKINRQTDVLLNRLYEYFSYPIHDILPEPYLGYLLNEINTLDKKLNDKLADFELKFGHNMQDAERYRSMIVDMRLLIQLIERLEEHKHMEYIEDTKSSHPGIKAHQGDASSIIEALVEKVTYEPYKDFMRQRLQTHWRGREDLLQQKTLDKIRERCKID